MRVRGKRKRCVVLVTLNSGCVGCSRVLACSQLYGCVCTSTYVGDHEWGTSTYMGAACTDYSESSSLATPPCVARSPALACLHVCRRRGWWWCLLQCRARMVMTLTLICKSVRSSTSRAPTRPAALRCHSRVKLPPPSRTMLCSAVRRPPTVCGASSPVDGSQSVAVGHVLWCRWWCG